VVSALHHVRAGELWTEQEIAKRKREIEWDAARSRASGLHWTVVESLPVHEAIKTRRGEYRHYLDVYKQSLKNLARHGLQVICYNFMPVLDWTRTELALELEDGSSVLSCEDGGIVAFDLFVLGRPAAEAGYTPEEVARARALFEGLDAAGRKQLADNILLGLPGTVDDLSVDELKAQLRRYDGIDAAGLTANLHGFLQEIMPLCDELGICMAIHPDDPPRPIFGLPRVMSTAADVTRLLAAVPSPRSGLTLCTGSFGGRKDNDPAAMFETFADRVHFAHFRNVSFEPGSERSFHESDHLTGHVDMARAMTALIREEERRRALGMKDWQIPVRPDHGKLLDCDRDRGCYPGYSYAGRMQGLAELRGLELGLRHALGLRSDV
jgi:mannonate dehydratase